MLFTDHKQLVDMMAKAGGSWSALQARHLATVSEFTTDVRHIEGKTNVVADTLSRAPIDTVTIGIDYQEMATDQASDPEARTMRMANTSLKLRDILTGRNGTTLLCDTTLKQPNPWVPEKWRRTVFNAVHSLAHPGVRATNRLISSRFVWTGMSKQIKEWVRCCQQCQTSKIQLHTKAPSERIPVQDARFEVVHIDLVGPLPQSQGKTHVLTVVDRFSPWPEVFPLSSTDTETVARALLSGWVARYGVPREIVSDRGPQFTSQIWSTMAQMQGAKAHTTTAYHPQANGLVERLHQQLKASLTARLRDDGWVDQLPWVLLRTAVKEDMAASPAKLLCGTSLRLPGKFREPASDLSDVTPFLFNLRKAIRDLKPVPTSTHRPEVEPRVPKDLTTCRLVFVRRDGHRKPLTPRYDGPYEVINRGAKYFKVRLGKITDNISVDHLKPAHIEEGTAPGQPKQQGRPPGPNPTSRRPSPMSDGTGSSTTGEQGTTGTTTTTISGRTSRRPTRYISTTLGGPCSGTPKQDFEYQISIATSGGESESELKARPILAGEIPAQKL